MRKKNSSALKIRADEIPRVPSCSDNSKTEFLLYFSSGYRYGEKDGKEPVVVR